MLLYSPAIQKAIRFSIRTHEEYQKQKRKGKDVPYITHPLTVGLILARARAPEMLVIAGILHDTIEDSVAAKKVTRAMLAERFGAKVAKLVDSVTEADKDASWEERKKEALEHIKHFSHEEVLLKSADVIANNSELLEDYAREGDKTFARFSAPKEKTVPYTRQVIAALLKAWPKSPLAPVLRYIAKHLAKI